MTEEKEVKNGGDHRKIKGERRTEERENVWGWRVFWSSDALQAAFEADGLFFKYRFIFHLDA